MVHESGHALVAFSLAVAAALAIKVPALFGMDLEQDAGFYARNVSLLKRLLKSCASSRRTSSGTLRG